MSQKKYFWCEEQDATIRRRYDSRPQTITDLARLFHLPRHAIRQRAQLLGVARCKEPRWTAEEEAYLERNLCRLSIVTLARKLRRSETAVVLKAKRLGIRKSDEGYTSRSLALAFGVDDHKIVQWIDRGMLKAARRHTERAQDMYLITDGAVRDFVAKHPLEFDLRKVDQLWFIEVMLDGLGKVA